MGGEHKCTCNTCQMAPKRKALIEATGMSIVGTEQQKRNPAWMYLLFNISMPLCSKCGNKRCPKARDHRFKCTNSNDSWQKGTYENTLY